MKRIIVLLLAFCMIFAVSCGSKSTDKPQAPEKPQEPKPIEEPATESITLYYTDSGASGLYAEERKIDASKAKDAATVAQELLKGTTSDRLVSVIPEGTKLNSCTVQDGICTLDLSSQFISNSGTANEQLSIYSVVNTLCLLDDVEEVKFLIDGKEVTIYGSYIFSEPFEPDTTIVK